MTIGGMPVTELREIFSNQKKKATVFTNILGKSE